ncbi:hypothetical protein [Mesorhizobium sp. M8A.F.Ca.ET.021.01.1.1]|uniref:hypothetical protein n=1 Tax=Mesorhizobium sp. M8A.F.Ca.ET.021.01.1.1 TaxID=2496757 RepID=UPI000FCB949F|nr:hypothetical protein [Mesorhizobium sp. M8A.F.Ca.ET.021.01.1.1]RUW53740.1 hypothetical protein EOA36_10145 [Mesorhizobium sp. M8A.F.Ca.ET.021.01.1.1]
MAEDPIVNVLQQNGVQDWHTDDLENATAADYVNVKIGDEWHQQGAMRLGGSIYGPNDRMNFGGQLTAAKYEPMTRRGLLESALNQPLSIFSTLEQSARQGVLDSYVLGTILRHSTLPEEAPVQESVGPDGKAIVGTGDVYIPPDVGARDAFMGNWGDTPAQLEQRRNSLGAMTEDQYKASPWFRKDIPYDPGMTETRAAALAQMYDIKAVRDFYAQKRPFAAFIGGLAGQALDPINYIPVFGPEVKAAAIARFGLAGRMATNAAEAAINTGVADVVTRNMRVQLGDDVSWENTVSSMAMAALIGGGFGLLHGAIEGRTPRVDPQIRARTEENLSTLKNIQEARIALNEGIDAVVHGEDVNLSPNATEPLARITNDVQRMEATRLATVDAAPVTKPATMEDVAASYRVVADANPQLDPTVSPSQFDSLMIADLQSKGFDAIAGDEKARPMPLSFNPATIDVPVVTKSQSVIDPTLKPGSPEFVAAVAKQGAKQSEARIAQLTRQQEIGNRMHNRLVRWLDATTGIGVGFGRFDNHNMLPELIAYHQREIAAASKAVDTQRPAPEALPDGIKEAQARVSRPEDLAAQYHVDPKTGAFKEEADLRQLADEGRLSEDDLRTMEEAHTQFDQATAYGEALKSLASCLI